MVEQEEKEVNCNSKEMAKCSDDIANKTKVIKERKKEKKVEEGKI